MIVLDVNVLLAAFRADHVHHGVVRAWFDAAFVPGADVAVPDVVWVGFLRSVTSRHVFDAAAHGNLVPDAYIAAVAMQHAAPVASLDRDFRRFTDLRIIDPGGGR